MWVYCCHHLQMGLPLIENDGTFPLPSLTDTRLPLDKSRLVEEACARLPWSSTAPMGLLFPHKEPTIRMS